MNREFCINYRTFLLISTYFQGCPYKGCGKSYILHNSLQKHVTARHSGTVLNFFYFFIFFYYAFH